MIFKHYPVHTAEFTTICKLVATCIMPSPTITTCTEHMFGGHITHMITQPLEYVPSGSVDGYFNNATHVCMLMHAHNMSTIICMDFCVPRGYCGSHPVPACSESSPKLSLEQLVDPKVVPSIHVHHAPDYLWQT